MLLFGPRFLSQDSFYTHEMNRQEKKRSEKFVCRRKKEEKKLTVSIRRATPVKKKINTKHERQQLNQARKR